MIPPPSTRIRMLPTDRINGSTATISTGFQALPSGNDWKMYKGILARQNRNLGIDFYVVLQTHKESPMTYVHVPPIRPSDDLFSALVGPQGVFPIGVVRDPDLVKPFIQSDHVMLHFPARVALIMHNGSLSKIPFDSLPSGILASIGPRSRARKLARYLAYRGTSWPVITNPHIEAIYKTSSPVKLYQDTRNDFSRFNTLARRRFSSKLIQGKSETRRKSDYCFGSNQEDSGIALLVVDVPTSIDYPDEQLIDFAGEPLVQKLVNARTIGSRSWNLPWE